MLWWKKQKTIYRWDDLTEIGFVAIKWINHKSYKFNKNFVECKTYKTYEKAKKAVKKFKNK
jgi:hypothetical protein